MGLNSQVNIMLHQSHAGITGPALFVVVTHNVFIVRVWVLCEIPLYQVPGLISRKPTGQMEKYELQYSHT